MVKCKSCGGTYEPDQPGGLTYFHACPPLSAPELQAAVDDGRVQLPKGETVEDALARRVYERANKRDENVMLTGDERNPTTVKAEGAGVDELEAAAPAVVVVAAADGV